jgi:hypothetical protein
VLQGGIKVVAVLPTTLRSGHFIPPVVMPLIDISVGRIQSLREETGVNNPICWMNSGGLPQDLVNASMHRLATEVIPALRQ